MTKGLQAVLALAVLTVIGTVACGYSDPYASNGPVANESPGPSNRPTPTPGLDDFNAGGGLSSCSRSAKPACVTYPDGLRVIDLTVGTGTVAVSGMNAEVQYTGWLTDGTSFDSSRNPGRTTFTFQIGQSQVIGGWDEGVPGMKVGGKRKLVIPPSLGYGASGQTDPNTGAQTIPPNATLVFDVELISLKPGPSPSPSPSPSK
ncbi:MAG TPA: FKBP-type peptidyl-prolyl cis-trans isomerase [Candidatus Dormibacteraeota bacterium]|nr:FKBP-type peptidyl-prolyl cis-trans isomerase [Candidatus Dormibacteraeota bacterium]